MITGYHISNINEINIFWKGSKWFPYKEIIISLHIEIISHNISTNWKAIDIQNKIYDTIQQEDYK
jgi:hypothetical protein